MLLKPVQMVLNTAVDASSEAKPCASAAVLSNLRRGRHGIAIAAVDNVYIGDANVTSSTGMKIPTGTIWEIPVEESTQIPCYVVGGECVLLEYF